MDNYIRIPSLAEQDLLKPVASRETGVIMARI